jgi:putative ABC transport system permease protein
MMGELVVRNLLHRPLRTLIGVVAVAVEVALVVLIVGLTSGSVDISGLQWLADAHQNRQQAR